eukprot:s1190_g22.t1
MGSSCSQVMFADALERSTLLSIRLKCTSLSFLEGGIQARFYVTAKRHHCKIRWASLLELSLANLLATHRFEDCWLETDAAAAAAALAKLEGQAEVCKADVADIQKQLEAVSGQLGEHTERIRGLQSVLECEHITNTDTGVAHCTLLFHPKLPQHVWRTKCGWKFALGKSWCMGADAATRMCATCSTD